MAVNLPKISIITVCYNAEQTIEETIVSVLDQTYSNIEYIIIDGYSKDKTCEIIKRFENKISHFVSEPDNGVYDAMNKALDIASGDWLYFLGSDDVFFNKDVVSEIITSFHDNDTLYYGNVIFKKRNFIYRFDVSAASLCYKNISHQSLFYPKTSYKAYKYDLKYKVFADHIYNILIFGSRKFKFKYVDIIVAIYNDSGLSAVTPSPDKSYFDDLPKVVNKHMGMIFALYVKIRILGSRAKQFFKRK